MIVVHFQALNDFLAELKEHASTIADHTVRWQPGRMAKDRDGIEFEVAVWGTAVVAMQDADYLLEYGESAGIDRDAHGDVSAAGTERAAQLHKKLQEHCDDLGLRVKPGKIEVF